MRVNIIGNIAKTFKDIFSVNGPLDIASDGTKWDILRGNWSVSSNKIQTSSAASEYPIVSVDTVSSDVDISIKDMSQGVIAALWVTDSGNWWGLGIDQTALIGDNNNATGCGCSVCTGANYEGYYYACGSYTYYVPVYYYCCNVVGNRYCKTYGGNCSTYGTKGICVAWFTAWCTAYNAGNCNETNTQCFLRNDPVTNTNYCVGYTVTGYYNYTCGCVTCYPQYIRLIKSVSNTISEVTSTLLSNSSIVRSIKAIVRGDDVTVKAYENTDLTSQIGADLVYTPTDVAVTPRYGISLKPSSYNQGSTSGEIEIEYK